MSILLTLLFIFIILITIIILSFIFIPKCNNEKFTNVNKTIWILWLQGWNNKTPELVQLCKQSWIDKNPNWNVVLLDENNIHNYIKLESRHLKLKMKNWIADIIRIKLMKKHGGIYVDATCYCHKSLDEWLPYDKPFVFKFDTDRIMKKNDISLWFLSFPYSNTKLATQWEKNADNAIKKNKNLDYFFFRKALPKSIANFHTLNSEKAHQLQFNKDPLDTPVSKLSWKNKHCINYLKNYLQKKIKDQSL